MAMGRATIRGAGLGALAARLRGERGQTFTEYAIIVAAITLGVLLGVEALRDAIVTALSNAASNI